MVWERTAFHSAFRTPNFTLAAHWNDGAWCATVIATSAIGMAPISVPTLPDSTRDEAEVAAVIAARELAAELALAARKASLP